MMHFCIIKNLDCNNKKKYIYKFIISNYYIYLHHAKSTTKTYIFMFLKSNVRELHLNLNLRKLKIM